MAKRDCYEVLGVRHDASTDEIRKAFRREAAKHHPDLHSGDAASEARFKEVNAAYQILKDEQQRKIYDQYGWAGLEGGATARQDSSFSDVKDVFSTMQDVFADAFQSSFGAKIPGARTGGRRAQAPRRGQDIQTDYTLSFHEALFGCVKSVPVSSAVTCSQCDGSGARSGTAWETCKACMGTGDTSKSRGFVLFSNQCGRCRGTGRFVADPCSRCFGKGSIDTERRVDVQFPAGIPHGYIVRVADCGAPGVGGGPAGDLLVMVYVAGDDKYTRVADDLTVQVHILFTTALLGGDVVVPVPNSDGHDALITVRIPPGTQNGSTVRLPGMGVPHLHQSGRGSLVVCFLVDLPATLSDRARALIAELNAELAASMHAASAAVPVAIPANPPPSRDPGPTSAQDDAARFLNGLPLRSTS